jgi:signal transduction histidine kinase
MIRSEIHRLSTMIQETLAMGRIDSGKMQTNPRPFDVRQLFGRVANQAHLAYKDHPEVIIHDNLESEIFCTDSELLFLILLNLISNGYKYSPPGSDVHVRVGTIDDTLHFEVQDYGVGIPLECRPRLFEAFFRASNVGKQKGTGVGLYVTKCAVEMCQGSISFTSEPGNGTTFIVDIPPAAVY